MKQDFDRLMEERDLNAIVVSGKRNGNPVFLYVTNGAKVIQGHVVKKRGEEAVFLCPPIDREEAAQSGLEVVTTNKYDFEGILSQTPDPLTANVELYRRIFADLGVGGRVGFYGMADQGSAWAFLNALNEQIEGIEVFGEYKMTLIDVARATKDQAEMERIRAVGKRTQEIMGEIVEFLKSHTVESEMLVKRDGFPLTIGHVHKEVGRLTAQAGLEIPEGLIFSMGRDAGVPHNKGNPDDVIQLGKSIIFDFAPREVNGGYYYDMTRTFCLGFAPPEVEKAYQDVKDCIEKVTSSYQVGTPVRHYQQMACDLFESRGHPTLLSDSKTENGFVHGLGHGIGLAVHEEPFFTAQSSNPNVITPGQIFTCEPGVYYPDRGYGVRIEDIIWIDPSGNPCDLTDFPKDLVVKM